MGESSEYRADEILAMAERLETHAAAFYRRAAKQTTSHATEKLLKELASFEDDHARRFAAMRAEIADDLEACGLPIAQDRIDTLNAVADCRFLSLDEDTTESLSPDATPAEIFDFATRIEKETIVFYTAMKDLIPPACGPGVIDSILAEEVDHIRILTAEGERGNPNNQDTQVIPKGQAERMFPGRS